MYSECAACPHHRNGAPATLPPLRAHRARSMHEEDKPSPKGGVPLPHSLEKDFADRTATAQCAPAISVAPPTPVRCLLASRSIAAASNDVPPEPVAIPAGPRDRQIPPGVRFLPAPKKSPTGNPAFSRSQTSPSL